jgi:propanol-preferring alcohol dehydrogenase
MGLEVLAIDGGSDKGELCKKLGARTYVDYETAKDIVADVKAATDERMGPHAVLLIAPFEKPFHQASEYIRPRGTIVAIGMPANAFLRAPVFDTVVKMITIKGSYVGNRRDTAEAIQFFARGLVSAPLEVMGLSQLQEIFERLRAGKVKGRIVVDTSK